MLVYALMQPRQFLFALGSKCLVQMEALWRISFCILHLAQCQSDNKQVKSSISNLIAAGMTHKLCIIPSRGETFSALMCSRNTEEPNTENISPGCLHVRWMHSASSCMTAWLAGLAASFCPCGNRLNELSKANCFHLLHLLQWGPSFRQVLPFTVRLLLWLAVKAWTTALGFSSLWHVENLARCCANKGV